MAIKFAKFDSSKGHCKNFLTIAGDTIAYSPSSKPSNLITTFFICYFVFRGVDTFILGNDQGQADSDWGQWKKQKGITSETTSEHSEHWKKAHEALQKSNGTAETSKPQHVELPSDVLQLVTFPIWFRKKAGSVFTPGDPEFKDYAKFQADKKKQNELSQHVANLAVRRLTHDPLHHRNLHVIEWNGAMHFHFDVIPQLHAPPSYEVPALIIFKDGIGFGWKELNPEIGSKMEAIFNPSATWSATKASVRAFYTTSALIVKAKIFGTEPPQILLRGHKHGHDQASSQSTKQITSTGNDNTDIDAFQWPKDQITRQELVKALHNSQATKQRHSDLLQNLPLTTAVQVAAHVFRHRQHHAVAEKQQRRARGVVILKGNAVCKGRLGVYKFTVLAMYSPSEERFIGHITLPHNQCVLIKNFDVAQKIEDTKRKALQAGGADRRATMSSTNLSESAQTPGTDVEEGKPSRDVPKPGDHSVEEGSASRPSDAGNEKE